MLTLADAIIAEDLRSIHQALQYGEEINQLDVYGFTPLIEAAIADNLEITQTLLNHGANPNLQDVTGGTPLHWAAENNNKDLCELLLKSGANPNAYSFAGQPVSVMPTLRRQTALRKLLIQYGADPVFTQDYINVKQLGHLFELVGMAEIVTPNNKYVDVDFEGFYLEVTLALISESLSQFHNHFAARQLRRYSGIAQGIVGIMEIASQLIKFQQYRTNLTQHQNKINALLKNDPLLIPIGYEGHAITFIKFGDILAKCDRREDSRLYDNIMLYRIQNHANMNVDFIKKLIYEKQTSEFINQALPGILGLKPITEIKVAAQISGNCSWANVEAVIPTLFFLILMHYNKTDDQSYYKTLALNFFHRWREWNKDRALNFCIQTFQEADVIRKATKAEILAAILFQRCHVENAADKNRIETILNLLLKSPYEYLLHNYLKVYYYKSQTEEGKQFFDLLKSVGYQH